MRTGRPRKYCYEYIWDTYKKYNIGRVKLAHFLGLPEKSVSSILDFCREQERIAYIRQTAIESDKGE